MNITEKIQELLGVAVDGDFGKNSKAAFDKIIERERWHRVKASSFADPGDITAFKRCKAAGNSDNYCFSKGDNGIGAWGDDTTKAEPLCALPRDLWAGLSRPNTRLVEVVMGEKRIVCRLADTMPSLANIKNGAGIDLNPEAVKMLGLRPPIMVNVKWRWFYV